jgi:hypothetical protein
MDSPKTRICYQCGLQCDSNAKRCPLCDSLQLGRPISPWNLLGHWHQRRLHHRFVHDHPHLIDTSLTPPPCTLCGAPMQRNPLFHDLLIWACPHCDDASLAHEERVSVERETV